MKIKSFALFLVFGVCSTIGSAQEKLTPALWKRIEAESPKSLPQSPAVKRETSDAQDEGLKGKVKRVIEEFQSYADVCESRGRHLSTIDDYDASGNQIRNALFANCGELIQITVYGFLDGFRVGLDKDVSTSKNRLTMVRDVPAKPNPQTQKRDQRYTYKYEYLYTKGNLTQMRMFHNDGRRGMYYKYSTSPTERSTSAFTEDDKPNWRTVYKLDDKGNEIEHINVDVRKIYGHDTVYRINNKAFDPAGNWIQRSTYEVKSEGGKISEVLISDQFRTITYH